MKKVIKILLFISVMILNACSGVYIISGKHDVTGKYVVSDITDIEGISVSKDTLVFYPYDVYLFTKDSTKIYIGKWKTNNSDYWVEYSNGSFEFTPYCDKHSHTLLLMFKDCLYKKVR